MAIATIVGGGCGSSSPGSNPDPLTLAVVPAENAQAIEQQFAPFTRFLTRQTGRKVIVIPASSYAAVIEALRFKKADIAVLGPLSYVIARNQGVALDVVGAQIPAKGAAPTYRSVAVAAPSSPVRSLEEAKDERVCFADPTSTSGYLYPYQALLAAGVDPHNELTTVFAGGPDTSALGAAHGRCALGFSFDAVVEKILPDAGALAPGDLRVIWRSTPIPGSPVVIRSDLDAGLKDKLTGAILKANDDAYKADSLCPATGDCGVSGTYGYVKATDSFYDTIRQACRATAITACKRL